MNYHQSTQKNVALKLNHQQPVPTSHPPRLSAIYSPPAWIYTSRVTYVHSSVHFFSSTLSHSLSHSLLMYSRAKLIPTAGTQRAIAETHEVCRQTGGRVRPHPLTPRDSWLLDFDKHSASTRAYFRILPPRNEDSCVRGIPVCARRPKTRRLILNHVKTTWGTGRERRPEIVVNFRVESPRLFELFCSRLSARRLE